MCLAETLRTLHSHCTWIHHCERGNQRDACISASLSTGTDLTGGMAHNLGGGFTGPKTASDEKWSWGTSQGRVSRWTDFLVQGVPRSSLKMSGPQCRWMLGRSVPVDSAEHSSSQHHGLCFYQEAPRPPSCKSPSDSCFSRFWWWTGKPGMLQSLGSQRMGYDWVTELNWTEDP